MSIPRFAVKHPVTATIVFAGLFVFGIMSLTMVGQELFPDIALPTAVVYTISPGVGPTDVEATISRPIETSVAGLTGVEQITSRSEESLSFVTVAFGSGTDIDMAVTEIRERLYDVEDGFPDGTRKPLIFKFSPTMLPSLIMNVYTETDGIDIRRLIVNEVVPELERILGVAQAAVFGGRTSAVMVRVNLDTMIALEIPMTQIMQVFEAENVSYPGGSLDLEDRHVVMRTIGEFESIEDIATVLIGYRGAVPIYLGDVAEITLDFLPQSEFVRTSGRGGVRLAINKQPGYNTVDVNDAVLMRLESLTGRLPPSIRFEVHENQADGVRNAIGGVATAAWQGGLLAILVLLVFLRNVRSTVIVSTVIPLSIIATFSLINLAGMTLNITSLLGITLAVGMFVDNAVVVLESVYRKHLAGVEPEQAAIEGAEEVATAITASTLTTVSVFLPVMFVEGLAGLMFVDLSLTIGFSLGVSLFAALALIPVLCARFLRLGRVKILRDVVAGAHHEVSLADVEIETESRILRRVSETIQHGLRRLDEMYERAIGWALDHVVIVIGAAVVLLVLSVSSILLLGMEFIPETDEGRFSIALETRVGAPYRVTTDKVVQVERIVREIAGQSIATMSSRIGDGGSNFGEIGVVLVGKENRDAGVWDIVNAIDREIPRRVLDVRHSIRIDGMAALASFAQGGGAPISIEVAGDDLDRMYRYAQTVEQIVVETPGTRSVRIDYAAGKPELQIRVNRNEAMSLGLSPLEIAGTIRTAYRGSAVSRFRQGADEYDVMLVLRDEDRLDLDRLASMFFVNRAGTKIPIENVATIDEALGPISITRDNRTRVIRVLGELSGERALNAVTTEIEARVSAAGGAPPGLEVSFTGARSQMDESFEGLFFALLIAAMLVYMVMASQFESFTSPLIIMFSIPFSIIGLVAALLATNTTFNLLAFVGAILLVGLVVNNAIVLIDYINTLRKRGLPLRDAIIQAGRTRLKPILMTTTTTVLGLLPMAIGIGTGSELQAPLGRAVVGGLTTSTLITLVLIPTLYWVVHSAIARRGARAHDPAAAAAQTGELR